MIVPSLPCDEDVSCDFRTKVLEKNKVNPGPGDFTVEIAGLIMHCNTAVRLSAMLEYLCAELMELSCNAARVNDRKITTKYLLHHKLVLHSFPRRTQVAQQRF